MSSSNKGIDWGLGQTNIDKETGIRFGVISQNEVIQEWSDSSEPYYIYTCPYCGNFLKKGQNSKRCGSCYKKIDPDRDFDMLEPSRFILDDGEYIAEQYYDDPDIFILKSPYFTYAQFCSPCAPGAGYIMNQIEDKDSNNRAFCFGDNFFESGKAPYKVYSVATGKEIIVEEKESDCPNCNGSGFDTVARIALARKWNTTRAKEDLIKHGFEIDELDRFKCFRCQGEKKIVELVEREVE